MFIYSGARHGTEPARSEDACGDRDGSKQSGDAADYGAADDCAGRESDAGADSFAESDCDSNADAESDPEWHPKPSTCAESDADSDAC